MKSFLTSPDKRYFRTSHHVDVDEGLAGDDMVVGQKYVLQVVLLPEAQCLQEVRIQNSEITL